MCQIFFPLVLFAGLTVCPADLRCSGGLGVPCRRKGHGSSGGSCVRGGSDHSHHPYLILPHPGYSVNGCSDCSIQLV